MINMSFDERKNIFDKQLYKESTNEFELEEIIEEGKAKIKFSFDKYCIAFLKVDKNKFPYIEYKKCADTIVLKKIDENRWELKVIEFKKTMSISAWEKSKNQFKGAIFNSMAISGVLGIGHFESIELYSAFRYSKLSIKEIENPVLIKQLVGEKPEKKIQDWEDGYVDIDFIDSKLKLNKINLDSDGNGQATL